MVPTPRTITRHVGRWDATVHVWRKLREMDVPRRQRVAACLIAFTHRPIDIELTELTVEPRRPT